MMMSELVAGSAWIWPPVDGCALAATGVLAGLLAGLAEPELATVVNARALLPLPPAAADSPARAALKVEASATASAFLR
ncbi:hypothetical protein D9M68_925270 [compost metagenome]